MTLSRRHLLRCGAAGALGLAVRPSLALQDSPELARAVEQMEPYLTPQEKFRDVSRGKPVPHSLPPEKLAQVGLTRETWKLEVLSDPENKAAIENPITLGWEGLMRLAEKRAVSYLKVMTCNNIGRPLGMGLWEGVPLRDVVWMTKPKENLRRVFYYGYHNDDPRQMFRSSLPIGRVLEDPPGLPPVLVCYKLNGEFLTPKRGGPVRILVPEAYGFKSVKWLTHVVLTNLAHANDTYADGNNDIDSPLKTFARTSTVPKEIKAERPIPVTGIVQVGISGLSKVQVWVSRAGEATAADDPYFAKAPWKDADILPLPAKWTDGLAGGKLQATPLGFDPNTARPARWPMPLTKAHWATLLPGLPEGKYTLRCRSIDGNGIAQPMPRPFDKSGRASIEATPLNVTA